MKLSNGSHPRLHMILIAGLVSLLFKYSSNKDIIVGTAIYKQDIEGEFINTVLALRNQLQDHITFKELLLQVRQTIAEAVENQNFPIELIFQKLKIPFSKTDDFPIFDIVVLLENIQDRTYVQHINPNMFFFFLETGDSVDGVVAYNSSLYKKGTMERINVHFRHLMHQVLVNIELSLAQISILSDEEKRRLLVEFNDTQVNYPGNKTIIELFQQQVEKTPDHIAVVYQDNQVTYNRLNKLSGRLFMILKKKGVNPDTIVGVMINRSLELIIGILGILKTGAAYLPIDPENPGSRIEFILKDSNTPAVVVQGHLTDRMKVILRHFSPGRIIPLDEKSIASDPVKDTPRYTACHPGNMVYVIYTSGTTGKPKGVIVDHRGLVNYIWWAAAQYVKNEAGNFPLFTSTAFDLTITSIFTPLITGNAVVVYGEEDENKEMLIEKITDENRVGIVKLTPSHLKLLRDKPIGFSSIKHLIVGGEELSGKLAGDTRENFNNNIEIFNEYGPTEAVVGCMIYKFDYKKDTGGSVPIGTPIDNAQIYLLAKNLEPVPIGVMGEIYISGDGIARGYLNRPELTAEKFIPNPFILGKPMYKTGDRAIWLQDGKIEFQGRLDQQVKIRGFRIEPAEIERLLSGYAPVKEAVVGVRENNMGEKQLVAYVVPADTGAGGERIHQENLETDVWEYLEKKLPSYMIPSYLVLLEIVPLTKNGKIDKRALPEPGVKAEDQYHAPASEVEEKLAGIWSQALDLNDELVSISTNFFRVGGHSLSAIRLLTEIHKAFDVVVPLTEFFKQPTIKGLSEYINEFAEDKFVSIEPVEKKEFYSLSSTQKRVFIMNLVEEESLNYNLPTVVLLEGDIEKKRLEESLRQLIKRHESLRSSFEMVNGEVAQKIADEVEFAVSRFESRQEKAGEIIKGFIKPFDLSRQPLLKVGLIKIGQSRHIFMLDIHHIIADGTSLEIFVKDFMALYEGKELPRLKIQYKDYSEWLNRKEQREVLKKQEEYWRAEFAGGIPVLNMPYDFGKSEIESLEENSFEFIIDKEETGKLKELASREEVTLFMILLAIYSIFLSKICQQEDIAVGTAVENRKHNDLQPLIGIFANTLMLRNYPEGGKAFAAFLSEIRKKTFKALENQGYPFLDLVEELDLRKGTNDNSISNVQFQLGNIDMPEVEIPGLKLKSYDFSRKTTKLDLLLTAIEGRERIFFIFSYKTRCFRDETIKKFIRYFKKIVSSVLADPGKKLSEIEITLDEKRKVALSDFNIDLEDE